MREPKKKKKGRIEVQTKDHLKAQNTQWRVPKGEIKKLRT
jgi:hypothetical protein